MDTVNHLGELLSAYLDGELTSDELDRVARHLAHCQQCIAEFRHLQASRVAVRLLPRLELPGELCEVIGVEPAHLGSLLSAYLDGELSTAEVNRVSAHVRTCAYCAEELRELDAARSAIRSMPTLKYRHGEGTELVELPVKRPWLRIVAAAAAFAAVVGVGSVLTSPTTDASTVDLDSLAARHAARTSLDNGVAVVPAALTEAGE